MSKFKKAVNKVFGVKETPVEVTDTVPTPAPEPVPIPTIEDLLNLGVPAGVIYHNAALSTEDIGTWLQLQRERGYNVGSDFWIIEIVLQLAKLNDNIKFFGLKTVPKAAKK